MIGVLTYSAVLIGEWFMVTCYFDLGRDITPKIAIAKDLLINQWIGQLRDLKAIPFGEFSCTLKLIGDDLAYKREISKVNSWIAGWRNQKPQIMTREKRKTSTSSGSSSTYRALSTGHAS